MYRSPDRVYRCVAVGYDNRRCRNDLQFEESIQLAGFKIRLCKEHSRDIKAAIADLVISTNN